MGRYGLLLVIGVLAVVGIVGWTVFDVTTGLIDVLLFFALIAAVTHFHRQEGASRGGSSLKPNGAQGFVRPAPATRRSAR